MQINLTVGVMPGEVKQIVVEEGKTVREIFVEAGFESYIDQNYECRYNCAETDLESEVTVSGILLLSEKVKGASEEANSASSESNIQIGDIVQVINTDKYGRVVDILEDYILAVNFNGSCERVLVAEVKKVNEEDVVETAQTSEEEKEAEETSTQLSAAVAESGKKTIRLEVTEEEKNDVKKETVDTVTKFLNEAAVGNKDMSVSIKIGKKLEIKVICER